MDRGWRMSRVRAQIFCMASVKGGSGKTVLAATFATILCSIGKRVLLVDTDAATNGLTLLYMKEVVDHREELDMESRAMPAGTYELSEDSIREPGLITLSEGLSLLPSTYSFFDSEEADVDRYINSLRTTTQHWRERFDFVFLDAQAGSDAFAHGAMRRDISDQVILVSEYDPLSAAGVERLKALFPEDLSYERTWILLNKMLPDIASKYGEFFEVARYLPPITWDADVVRAYARRSLALDLEYGNDFTVAACRTLGSMVDSQTERELDTWLSKKATELRMPMNVQIEDLRSELRIVEERRGRSSMRRLYLTTLLVVTVATLVSITTGSLFELRDNNTVTIVTPVVTGVALGMALAWIALRTSADSAPNERLADLRERLVALERLSDLSDRELVGRGKGISTKG